MSYRDKKFIKNSGSASEYAKKRLAMSFRDIVLAAVTGFIENEASYKPLREYFAQGGGASWQDIKKAIEDDSDLGKRYVEMFRQLVEAELMARGVYSSQAEKKIPKWY